MTPKVLSHLKHKIKNRTFRRVLIASAIMLLLVSGAAYSTRGILRSNLLPAYALRHHRDQLTETLNSQKNALDTALAPLGITLDHTLGPTCTLDIAIRWSTAVYCDGNIDSRNALMTGLHADSIQVQQATATMHRLGWYGGVDTSELIVTLSYSKTINGFDCTLQAIDDGFTDSGLNCSQDYFYPNAEMNPNTR